VEAGRNFDMNADTMNLMRKVREWLVATREVARLVAVCDAAQKTLDGVRNDVKDRVIKLTTAFGASDKMQTHRIFLPADRDVPDTIVEIVTGAAIESVTSHPVDFVGGEG
jgi:hypothetical protein